MLRLGRRPSGAEKGHEHTRRSEQERPVIRPLRQVIEELVTNALIENYWDTQRAAEQLGITQRTIYNKMREYGLTRETIRLRVIERRKSR